MDINLQAGQIPISQEEGEEVKQFFRQSMETLKKQMKEAPRMNENKEELLKEILIEAKKINTNLEGLIIWLKRENYSVADPEDSDF